MNYIKTIYWKVIIRNNDEKDIKEKKKMKKEYATILSDKGFQVVDKDNLIIKSHYPETLNVLSRNYDWIYTIIPSTPSITIPQNKTINRIKEDSIEHN